MESGLKNVSSPPNLHRFAVALAVATFCLIFVGGLVTSTGSALAVPDWPLSFGKFFPKMEGGVLYEHGHRMVAGVVAILTLVLAFWAWMREPRSWLRKLAAAALGLVLFQAVLGGLTVLLRLPLAIAVSHAATAQAFFCITVAIAAFTNPRWTAATDSIAPASSSGGRHLRQIAAATTVVVYVQILIGAVMRHMGAGLAIPDFPLSFGALVPPLDSSYVAINFAHRCGAVVTTIFIIAAAWTALRNFGSYREFTRPAWLLLILLAAQISLGALTVWSERAVLPATAHVLIGAAVLATSLTLALRAFHLIRIPEAEQSVAELDRVIARPQSAV